MNVDVHLGIVHVERMQGTVGRLLVVLWPGWKLPTLLGCLGEPPVVATLSRICRYAEAPSASRIGAFTNGRYVVHINRLWQGALSGLLLLVAVGAAIFREWRCR